MAGWIEKSFLAGVGVLTLTRDKVTRFVDKLVEAGEVKPEESPSILDKLVMRGETEREELRKLVRQEIDRLIPVSRQDVGELNRKMDELTAQIAKLTGEKAPKE